MIKMSYQEYIKIEQDKYITEWRKIIKQLTKTK